MWPYIVQSIDLCGEPTNTSGFPAQVVGSADFFVDAVDAVKQTIELPSIKYLLRSCNVIAMLTQIYHGLHMIDTQILLDISCSSRL